MIDWERLRDLRQEVGLEDFEEVLLVFLEEVDEVVERMRSNPEFATLEEDLHFLKGSALSLGFVDFSNLCQKGETAAAKGNAQDVDVCTVLNSYLVSKKVFQSERAARLDD